MAVERLQPPTIRTCRRTTWRPSSRCSAPCWSTPTPSRLSPSCSPRDDFYRDTHRLIYRGVLTLFERGEEVDVVTLSAQLEREGMLERAGGREFVHTLAEFVPAAANAAHYAGIVREQSVLRVAHPRGQRDRRARLPASRRHPPTCSTAASRRSSPSSSSAASREFQHIKEVLVRNFEHLATMQTATAASPASPPASRASTGSPAASRRPTSSCSPRAPASARRQPRAQHRPARGRRGSSARQPRSPSSAWR